MSMTLFLSFLENFIIYLVNGVIFIDLINCSNKICYALKRIFSKKHNLQFLWNVKGNYVFKNVVYSSRRKCKQKV